MCSLRHLKTQLVRQNCKYVYVLTVQQECSATKFLNFITVLF